DCVVLLAYVTPAAGVLLTPVMNFRVRDRARGTLTVVNGSVGVWKKLERIRRNPRVALALHTGRHGANCRAECVRVQGKAPLSETVADYPAVYSAAWEPIAINTCQRTDRHLARRPSRRHALGAKASPAPKPCGSDRAVSVGQARAEVPDLPRLTDTPVAGVIGTFTEPRRRCAHLIVPGATVVEAAINGDEAADARHDHQR